jgi:hypothetical protein
VQVAKPLIRRKCMCFDSPCRIKRSFIPESPVGLRPDM